MRNGILERIRIPMARPVQKKIYWDSNVFISLLDENSDRISAIRFVIDEVESGKAIIIVSTLVRVEVLPNKRDPELGREFENLLKNREQVREVAIDRRVIEAAKQIRASGRNVTTPDAIHLATASVHGAPIFHTYDEHLLNLRDVPGITKLTICKPFLPKQGRLTLE